jgi:activator of HSP90 ATPase
MQGILCPAAAAGKDGGVWVLLSKDRNPALIVGRLCALMHWFAPGERIAMTENCNPLAGTPTRRQIIYSSAVGLGSLVAAGTVWAQAQQPAIQEAPSTAANQKRTALHQEISFKASPQRIYDILLDSKQFAAFTGMPADIDPKAGGAFSTFGGLVVGRNIELIPGQRIVQAWRPTHWDSGVYSVVKFELKPQGPGVLVVLDHGGFPEGQYNGLYSGWKLRYWDPMRKYLG